jgi:ribosomal protein L10
LREQHANPIIQNPKSKIQNLLKGVTNLPTPAKESNITELRAELAHIQGAIVTDYRGLTMEQLTTLRRRLLPVNARYTVVKNTLLKRAMRDEQMADMDQLLAAHPPCFSRRAIRWKPRKS